MLQGCRMNSCHIFVSALNVHSFIHTFIHTHICSQLYLDLNAELRTATYIQAYLWLHTYIQTYMHIRTTHIHTHTYTRTHTVGRVFFRERNSIRPDINADLGPRPTDTHHRTSAASSGRRRTRLPRATNRDGGR